jgi:PAS domain S-box-containing protein
MHAGDSALSDDSASHSEPAFQALLLRFSAAAASGMDSSELIRLFCRETREFFQVDGAYLWRVMSEDELVGAEADGFMAADFRGRRLLSAESAVAMDAVREHRATYVHHVDPLRYRMAGEFRARSLMSAPLVVANDVIGAVVFLHTSNSEFFDQDMAAKATILATQLGSLLEARRLSEVSREERRRAGILTEVAQAISVTPDAAPVSDAIAERLRVLLRARLVCIFLQEDNKAVLRAISGEPAVVESIRDRSSPRLSQFAADLIARAAGAGGVISVTIDPAHHGLAGMIPAGMLLAAPFRTSRSMGAAIVYPRAEGAFSRDEKSLLAAVIGLGAVAITNAELCAAARSQAQDSQRLFEQSEEHRRQAEALISLGLELNRRLRLPEFAERFVAHAAQLTGAQLAALAVNENGIWEVLAAKGEGTANRRSFLQRLERSIPTLLRDRSETIASFDSDELPGQEVGELANGYLVRLSAADGELVGVLCLIRKEKLKADSEQVLQALSAHAASALQNARLFTRMDRANRHWIGIFDAIPDFIVAHDQSDTVLRVNRSLADFVGLNPEDLIGTKTYALFTLGSDAPRHTCPFCRTLASDGRDEHVLPILDRTYLVSTSRLKEPGSEELQSVHVLKDITDRREAERRYRELFDNIQEGVFFASADGRFVEVNDTLVRTLGYSTREQLLQADIRIQIFASPEHYEDFASLMREQGTVRNHELTLRRLDGSRIHVLVNAFAVRDSQQTVVQYRGVMLDVSGLRSSQSELQRERDFSGKVLNNTQSLILVTDMGGVITYANRRWYELGYQQHQLLGIAMEELAAAPRRQALREALAATVTGQQIDNLELQLIRGEARLGHFSVNLSPMRDEQGNISNIVVVMSDITDAATLQAKLIHAEKMAAVGQLVSGVAHEVNNPLTAILGFADLLMENTEVPASARKDLRVILQEAQRTKQIVQNLLSFARQMPPQRKPLQLNAILSRTVQLRAYDFHSHGIEVIEQLERDLHPVVGDSHQLQQVFLNILNNAYDAVRDTRRAARIEIRSANEGTMVEVMFRDNGQGIQFPERIFDPFFTTKEIGKGTGLGLSICYGIVREHGGEILCHNNPDGEGATFIVRLPAVSELVSLGAAAGVPQP